MRNKKYLKALNFQIMRKSDESKLLVQHKLNLKFQAYMSKFGPNQKSNQERCPFCVENKGTAKRKSLNPTSKFIFNQQCYLYTRFTKTYSVKE